MENDADFQDQDGDWSDYTVMNATALRSDRRTLIRYNEEDYRNYDAAEATLAPNNPWKTVFKRIGGMENVKKLIDRYRKGQATLEHKFDSIWAVSRDGKKQPHRMILVQCKRNSNHFRVLCYLNTHWEYDEHLNFLRLRWMFANPMRFAVRLRVLRLNPDRYFRLLREDEIQLPDFSEKKPSSSPPPL
jgi:hypothetical protein